MQQIYYCPKCNSPLAPQARFCVNCGTSLSLQQQTPTKPIEFLQQHSQLSSYQHTERIPLLLFIAPTLCDILLGTHESSTLPEINPIPDAIHTPHGLYPYPGIHRLNFISIPYIDEMGRVGRIQMRSFYLDVVIGNMAKELRLNDSDIVNSLLDHRRIAIVGALVADKPMLLWENSLLKCFTTIPPGSILGGGYLPSPIYSEYYPYYWSTNTDIDDIGIIKDLESNIIYCLDNQLNALPSSIVDSWIRTTLNPIMAKLKSKMK